MTAPAIGVWWTVCCVEDLYPIRNEEELAELRDWIEDNPEDGSDGVPAKIWPSLKAALADSYIASQVAAGDYSPQTAKRLALPLR